MCQVAHRFLSVQLQKIAKKFHKKFSYIIAKKMPHERHIFKTGLPKCCEFSSPSLTETKYPFARKFWSSGKRILSQFFPWREELWRKRKLRKTKFKRSLGEREGGLNSVMESINLTFRMFGNEGKYFISKDLWSYCPFMRGWNNICH